MGFTMILLLVYLVLFIIDVFALILGLKKKKWILFSVISSIIVISIIVLGYLWIKLPDENIEPIIFEKGSNGEYAYIIYEDREYVPYCAISPRERDCYLGYVGEDKQDEIYTYKNHSEEEWLISYLNSGMMNDCMLLKEKNVINIPDGLYSEYEWNSRETVELNKIYSNIISKDYEDIRKLEESYSSEEAQKDNCFVIGAMVHNDYLYSEFMNNYKNGESAFIRIAQNTVEGDLILYDIMYDTESKKLSLITDYTRDKFSSEEDRIIQLRNYDSISEYNYNGRLYWVLYNGELNDDTFETESVFIVTTIN